MATKLGVYNDALRLLGDTSLENVTEDVEPRYTLDSAWDGAVNFVLSQANWRFAMKSVALSVNIGPLEGYEFVYTLPSDHLRSYSLRLAEVPVSATERSGRVYSKTSGPSLAFVSSDYSDPALWADDFAILVAHYLAYECAKRLNGSSELVALANEAYEAMFSRIAPIHSIVDDKWYSYQIDGTFEESYKAVYEAHTWNFGTDTFSLDPYSGILSPSPGYENAFYKPAGWAKTSIVYILQGDCLIPIDFRDENGIISANHEEIYMRANIDTYLTDPREWPSTFTQCVFAYCQYVYATRDNQKSEDKAYNHFVAMLDVAKKTDTSREFKRVNRHGSFVRARMYGVNPEQRW